MAEDNRTPGASRYAVLSFDYWHRRFNGDPQVIGRTREIGNRRWTQINNPFAVRGSRLRYGGP